MREPLSQVRRRMGPRLRSLGTLLALAGLLVACGGKAVIDGTTKGEGGTGGAGGVTTTTTTTTTTTHAGGQGGGPLAISLSNVTVGIDCMPMVPPDPVDVSFTATYDNGSGASASASIVGATVSLGNPSDSLDWSFQVFPSSVGPVSGNSSVQVDHAKVAGSGTGSGSPCNFCSSASPLLTVDYLVDGQYSQVATASGSVGCGM